MSGFVQALLSAAHWGELLHHGLRITRHCRVSSQEVIKRDTITSYALQCPTSIVELGLRHAEQIALLEKVQNIVLAEQALLLAPGMSGCPTCGNTLKKNGDKTETIASLPGFGMGPEGHFSYSFGPNIRTGRTKPCAVRVRIDPIPPKE